MRPDRCGFGRRIEDLPDGDRQAVQQFADFLAGKLALAEDGVTYVQPDDERAFYFSYGGTP
jgi:hypothetical protein